MMDGEEDSPDTLGDEELLDREADQRAEFLYREQFEPQPRGMTFHPIRGSGPLIRAWTRWQRTSLAARLRGLLARDRNR